MSLNGGRVADHRRMIMRLDTRRLQTLEQVREFLAGSAGIDLQPRSRADAYAFVAKTLERFDYVLLGKADKGLPRRFLAKATGLSRAQVTRLLHQHRTTGGSATAAALRGGRSPAATPAPTPGSWPRPMRCTARCPARPRAPCARAPFICSATPASSVWPASPTATCTTCGIRRRTPGAAGRRRRRRARCGSPLGNAAARGLSDSPAGCGSTRSIKATSTASRACTT